MQITVNIPDELAAQLSARIAPTGVSIETYVEQLVTRQVDVANDPQRVKRLADLEEFFNKMASHADHIPILPESAFTRESFYADHD